MRLIIPILLLLGTSLPIVRSAEPPKTNPINTDAELARRVQMVLNADSVFRSRSLIVSVVDRVAVVGGPVASEEESAQIRQLLRVVPGLSDTKISTWVPVADDPLKKSITERLQSKREIESKTSKPLVVDDPRPRGNVVVQRFAPVLPAFSFLGEPVPRVSTVLPSRADSAYSPVPAPSPPAPEGPQYPTIPPPAVPVAPKQDVETAIQELQQQYRRYESFTITVRAGTVTIAGTSRQPEDSWEFAALIRKIPGVERVILGRIESR